MSKSLQADSAILHSLDSLSMAFDFTKVRTTLPTLDNLPARVRLGSDYGGDEVWWHPEVLFVDS